MRPYENDFVESAGRFAQLHYILTAKLIHHLPVMNQGAIGVDRFPFALGEFPCLFHCSLYAPAETRGFWNYDFHWEKDDPVQFVTVIL